MIEKIPVTVVIPVRNEERNLPLCLSRLSRFHALVVVDSGSTDATPDVARRFGAEVVQFKWDGHYPKKRNWMLLNHKFRTEWVLFLDADEVVDDRFCDAVQSSIRDGEYDGFWLNYTNYFLDAELRHGLPQRKLALFKVHSGLYERIDELAWSGLDMEIHEHPIIKGPIGHIDGTIEHRDFRGLSHFLKKHVDYAQWEARRILLLEDRNAAGSADLTKRQLYKYGNITKWWYPYVYFAYTYFIKLGMLDGRAGFGYAFYKLWYFKTIQLLVREYRSEATETDDTHQRAAA
jgi:glycosyltransferase involved in cell wall biosynthesis